MGIYEHIQEEKKKRGIVARLEVMPSRYAVCENCGKDIRADGTYESEAYTGRWLSEGEAKAWGKDPDKPVYAHVTCPEEGEE